MRRQEPSLLGVAAQLLTHQISDNPDDYPRKFPKWVLKYIQAHNQRQVEWSVYLKKTNDHFEKLQLENNVLKEQLKLAESQIDDLKQQVDELNKAVYQENGED